MRPLTPEQGAGITLASNATNPAIPTATAGTIAAVGDWVHPHTGATPQFDLEVWAEGSVSVTAAELVAGKPHTLAIADDAIESADATANTLTLTGHAYHRGDGPVFLSGASLPGGTVAATPYYVGVVDANTITLHTTRAAALGGTSRVDITSSGTGTIADDATTARVRWHSCGLLGNAGDGAITLTATRAYTVRVDHSARAVGYALVATATGVYAAIYPIVDR